MTILFVKLTFMSIYLYIIKYVILGNKFKQKTEAKR